MCDTLDRIRATGASAQPTNKILAIGDDGPLIVDWIPAQTGQNHWILEQIAMFATCTLRSPTLQPISGLYLCPQSTPVESLADSAAGWNPLARPFAIPTDIYVANITVAGSPQYAVIMNARAGFKQTLPAGWFVRGIIVCSPGLAAPGPGEGSTATLNVLATLEKSCAPTS